MVQEHFEHTHSPLAKNILDNWRLYDVTTDINERRDLSQLYPQRAASLKAEQSAAR